MDQKTGPSNRSLQTDLEDVSKLCAVDNAGKVRSIKKNERLIIFLICTIYSLLTNGCSNQRQK